jgi:hypothetical protein
MKVRHHDRLLAQSAKLYDPSIVQQTWQKLAHGKEDSDIAPAQEMSDNDDDDNNEEEEVDDDDEDDDGPGARGTARRIVSAPSRGKRAMEESTKKSMGGWGKA